MDMDDLNYWGWILEEMDEKMSFTATFKGKVSMLNTVVKKKVLWG